MTPKFSLTKNDKIYVGEKYLCNGHWLCTREIASSHVAPKALKPLLSLQIGCYDVGIAGGKTREKDGLPDFAAVIPKRDGYLPVKSAPAGVHFRRQDSDEVKAFKFTASNPEDPSQDFTFGVDQQYVPILRMGHIFAKDSRSAILVLDGATLNDNLLAVVMPYRID